MTAATKKELLDWFNTGKIAGRKRMIVWCDEFDYEDYPDYSDLTGQELMDYVKKFDGHNMTKLMEVYDLTASWQSQSDGRVYNY